MAIVNRYEHKSLRRLLRSTRLVPERQLWRQLRRQQIGYRFRTQYGVGRYVADFCCPRLRLIVEVDGSYHYEPEARRYDRIRQCYLERLGFTVVRYSAAEVMHDVYSVVVDIHQVCEELSASRLPPPAPRALGAVSPSTRGRGTK